MNRNVWLLFCCLAAMNAVTAGQTVMSALIGHALAVDKAEAAGVAVNWMTGDAADTGLPDGSFDAVVSNMGVIFVSFTIM